MLAFGILPPMKQPPSLPAPNVGLGSTVHGLLPILRKSGLCVRRFVAVMEPLRTSTGTGPP